MEPVTKRSRILILVLMYLASVPVFFFVLYMWPPLKEQGCYPIALLQHDFLASLFIALSVIVAPLFQFFAKANSPEKVHK
jgi:hypothetical protein